MKKTLAILLTTLLVFTLLPASVFAEGDVTLTVGSGEYSTIQDAINDAFDSGAGTKTILISAGTYAEDLEIVQQENINIVLQGEDGAIISGTIIIDGGGRYTGTDTLTIRNIKFDQTGNPTPASYIIDTKKINTVGYPYPHNITIEDCSFIGDDEGKTYAINAGASGGNTAYNTVIRNCTFDRVGCAVQSRSNGLLLENLTITNAKSGFNLVNSKDIIMRNVKAYVSRYAFRLGENSTGTSDNRSVIIENCELNSSSTNPSESAIVLRSGAEANIEIKSSDIIGHVYSSSVNNIKVTTDNVYWGKGTTFTGFDDLELNIQNNATAPHWISSSRDSQVIASADIAYMVVITPSVDFGTINRKMSEQSRDFVVAVEDALIEDGASIIVKNITTDMFMKDKNGTGTKTLDFELEQQDGVFEFMQEDLEDGEASILSAVTCSPSNLKAAGTYKGIMNFEISYKVQP